MAEAAPLPAPNRVMREYALAAVVVDEPDLAARIDFHAGVAVYGLTVKESATLVGDNPDYLVGTDLDWVKTAAAKRRGVYLRAILYIY